MYIVHSTTSTTVQLDYRLFINVRPRLFCAHHCCLLLVVCIFTYLLVPLVATTTQQTKNQEPRSKQAASRKF